jgi:hypothetical protein
VLSSYDALSNFYLSYSDLSHRLQKYVALYDDRDFLFTVRDPQTDQILFQRDEIRLTGAETGVRYPFGLNTRVEGNVGYLFRKFPVQVRTPAGVDTIQVEDDFPYVEAALVGDSTLFASWGPVAGRRWRIDGSYAPDLDESGTLTAEVSGDFRQYLPTSVRTGFAFRVFGGARYGNNPTPFFIGGESIRSFNFRELSGDRAGFAVAEYRFPLVDELRTPFLRFQNIRGRVFLDVGAVWYDDFGVFEQLPDNSFIVRDFEFWDSDENRLKDGFAVYGLGFTVSFLGLDLNWDIGKRWDLKETLSGFTTTFIIGTRF